MNSSRLIQFACPSVCLRVCVCIWICLYVQSTRQLQCSRLSFSPPPSPLFSFLSYTNLFCSALQPVEASFFAYLAVQSRPSFSFLSIFHLSSVCNAQFIHLLPLSLSFFNLTFVLTKRVIQTLPSHYIRTSALLTKRREEIETETRARQ